MRPGDGGERGEPDADAANGVGSGAAIGWAVTGDGVAEDEPEPPVGFLLGAGFYSFIFLGTLAQVALGWPT